MPVPFLSDIDLRGNKTLNTVLSGAKFGTTPSTPQAGHFYQKDGVLYYRNLSNVEIPVHENAITTVTAAGALVATTVNRAVSLSVASATTAQPGIISAADYSLLFNATDVNTNNSIVRRDANGSIAANVVTVSDLIGLPATPPTGSSAASKTYVLNQVTQALATAANNLDRKESVRVAITTNQALNVGSGTYGGVALVQGDRILLMGQTSAGANGAYVVGVSSLTRAVDSNSVSNLTSGATYYVEEGANAQNFFTLITITNAAGFNFGTTPLVFVNTSGTNTLLGGDGLTKIGQILNVVGTPDRLAVTADAIDIAPSYIGQSSINTLGTITTGSWQGGVIPVAYGGTGATTVAEALTNLGGLRKFASTVGDGTTTNVVVTHNLNTTDINVTVRDTTVPGSIVYPDIVINSANAITISFGTPPALNAYRCLVLG